MKNQYSPNLLFSATAASSKTYFKWAILCLATLIVMMFVAPSATAQDSTPKCGAHAQQKCEYLPATSHGKAKKILCPKGSFLDPRNGGECWKCPSKYGRTIGHGVASDKACSKLFGLLKYEHKKATFVRTVWGCGRDQIFDPSKKGSCWSCPANYNRSGHPVDGSLACTVKAKMTCDPGLKLRADARCYDPSQEIDATEAPSCGGLYELKCEFSHAVKIGKSTGLSCPDGGKWKPRNDGECWKCPANYNLSIHDVTSSLACTAPMGGTCKAGLKPDFGGICVYSNAEAVKAMAQQKMQEYAELAIHGTLLAADAAADAVLSEEVREKKEAAVGRFKDLSPYEDTAEKAEARRFKTISIGGLTEGNVVFIGGATETGGAIALKGERPVFWYGGLAYKLGPALSVDGGINVGLWNSANNDIGGDIHGFVFGLDDLIAAYKVAKGAKALSKLASFKPGFSCAIAFWFDYQGNFQGITVTPGVSKGVDFGGYARASTFQVVD